MKILSVFGQYQYGKEERGLSTEYFSFIPALEELGYEIVFFDSWNRTLYNDFIELNNAFINIVEIEKPDIIFTVQLGYEIWLETWDYIRANNKCKTINWCTDDSWKYKEHSKFLAPHFDLMVTTYKEFLPEYKKLKSNAILSTWGVPIQWITSPKKSNDCKYQVVFVGAAHGDRKKKIEKIEDEGIKVSCFGYGWDAGPIEDHEIPKIFNDSIISLNFANSSGENQIKARIFEVTGSGGFLLTEDAKGLSEVFNSNEIIIFDDINNCIEKIKYYLGNLEVRDNIAFNGFNKTSGKYTYSNRFKEIFITVQAIEKNHVKNIDFEKIVDEHKNTFFLNFLKSILLKIGYLIYGKEKGKRFARRVVYEFSWRVFGVDTYKSKGIVGRMFYNE
mgnify:FL=1